MRQVQAQLAEHGTTWFAWHQTAGKGQRGRTWEAEPGSNIILSSVVQPPPDLFGNQFTLSMMVALSCYDFFSRHALNETKIKWPNDIYWKDRKAGGILIENVFKGAQWRFSVIGIGININQTLFTEVLAHAVSLKQITGKTYNVIDLAKELCACLESRWKNLQLTSAGELLQEYCSHLYRKGQEVAFKKDAVKFHGKVEGVNLQGELLISTGEVNAYSFGTIEWVTA